MIEKHRSLTSTILCSIDGVLKAGNTVLPAALRAIKILEGDNRLKKKVPYIFITNGGGPSEIERARRLSYDFDVEVSEVIKEWK
jgi:ribonucleotide monophosphatase NagD (HAD superfamily)